MTVLAQTFALFSPMVLGWGLLRSLGLRWRDDTLAFPAWAYLVGTLTTGLLLFAFLWTGIDPVWFTPLPGGVGCILLFIAGRLRRGYGDDRSSDSQSGDRTVSWLVWPVLTAASALTCIHVVEANTRAIVKDDEAQIWAAKANAIYDAGGFGTAFRARLGRGVGIRHRDYPLLNPLLQVWTRAHAAGPLDFETRLPIQAFSIALLFLAAGALRARAGPLLTCLLLAALATTSAHRGGSATADADTMVAFGLLAALDALDRFLDRTDSRFAVLGAAALAFLAWSKNEGSMLALMTVTVLTVAARTQRRATDPIGWRSLTMIALAPLAIVVLQSAFNQHYGFRNDLLVPAARPPIWERLMTQYDDYAAGVLREFGTRLFAPRDQFNLILGAFVVSCVASPHRLLAGRKVLLGAPIALGLVAYALVYLSTPYDLEWHMDTSLARVLYHLTPASCVCVGAFVQSAFDRHRDAAALASST